ncbi:hypothetical protein NDU88_004200 [Pleurodeles waltl]|uniref:Methylcytosine dioxygenase TET n=1 Tax=Pleurodeles waltl TaxID=8319 RepID=A0AAV7LJ62_PLEWA|nr:hypothetical protein NDU88_004200 [Pleurodeles waltl]
METIQLPMHINETAQELYDICGDKNMLEGFVDTLVMEEKGGARKSKETVGQTRKKRKRCGLCTPCMRKEACGSCYNCINRRTSHQICKLRKCERLKKKSGTLNESETGLERSLGDGLKTDHLEGGRVNHVEERRLKTDVPPNFINGSCEEMGSKMIMEAKEWINGHSMDQNANEKLNWGAMPVLSQAVVPNNASLEDARNLVAFSAVAEAMSSYAMPVSVPQSQLSMHLYEKFNYEMGRDGAGVPPLSVSNKLATAEELNSFKTALTLAKHGVKPPNCNCEGPECPDYLEWLEKKIQSAIREDPNPSHPLSQVHNMPSGKADILDHVPAIENILSQCSSNPLPFSQSALSIAKEKNISLQTAIAIEALTQLSSALPQQSGEVPSPHSGRLQTFPLPSQHHLVHPASSDSSKSHVLPMCNDLFANDISQPYIEKKLLQMSHAQMLSPWEQVKKTDQELSHYIPDHNLLNPPSLFNVPTPIKKEFPTDWGTEVKTKNSLWDLNSEQCPSEGDPMSGLKQLLGDANDFIKSEFKRPEVFNSKLKSVKPKVEPQSPNLNNGSNNDIYKLTADQQLSQLLQENTFHKEGPALHQQNIHHKRHLFQDENLPLPNLPEQQNWWIPKSENTLQNHTEKSAKERKKRVQSPLLGQVDLKAKPQKKAVVQIKKAKQKDTNPACLPMLQIQADGFNKSQNTENHSNEIQADQYLPEIGIKQLLPSPSQLSSQSLLQKQLENTDVSDTQEMCTPRPSNAEETQNQGDTSVSNYTSCLLTSQLSSSSKQDETTNKPLNVDSLPIPNEMNSVDAKFQELIREFEAEFGEDFSLVNSTLPSQSTEGLGTKVTPYTSSLPLTPKPTNTSPLFTQATSFGNSTSSSDCAYTTVSASQVISQHLFSSKSPKQVKIESSGALTVLSTTCFYPDESQDGDPFLDSTPTKNEPFIPSLSGFLESPLKYLDSPTKSLFDTPSKKAQAEFPTCDCVDQIVEKDEGPYYTHLGSGPNVASIRELMEGRYGQKGKAIRIEKVIYTGKEGKSSHGCPIAKWVIRRQNEDEKIMCLVRHRAGHHCDNAVIIILIMAWEGIPQALGDALYAELTETITKYGNPTSRRCGLNDDRTCACQGMDPNTCGASFSFGCSWSMYFNGCKYARSKFPRKFRLAGENHKEEEALRNKFQDLATKVAPLYKKLAPQAYQNQVKSEEVAIDCRLGLKEGRPFAGVTACMDFCAHAHKDQHNLYNGCTVVCTLTKEDNRTTGKIPEDEQLHVLPLYKVSNTDEFGSEENQAEKIKNGGIQVLSAFPREVRKLAEPAKSCRQRQLEARKAAAERKKMIKDKLVTPEKPKQESLNMQTLKHSTGASMKERPSQLPIRPAVKVEPQNHYNSYKSTPIQLENPFAQNSSCFSRAIKQEAAELFSHVGAIQRAAGNIQNSGMTLPGVSMSSYNADQEHLWESYKLRKNGYLPEKTRTSSSWNVSNENDKLTNANLQDKMNPFNMYPHAARIPNPYIQENEWNMVTNTGAPMQDNVNLMGKAWSSCKLNDNGLVLPESAISGLQEKSWTSGQSTFSSVSKDSSGFQDNSWNPFNMSERQAATPSTGLYEKTWNSFPASVTDSDICSEKQFNTLKRDINSGVRIDHHEKHCHPSSLDNNPEEFLNKSVKDEYEDEVWSDSEHNFLDENIGGVAVAPGHGSILIECARRELHATTPLKKPNRCHPSRISLVFYQHKNLNQPTHGQGVYEAKMRQLEEKAKARQEEAARLGLQEDLKSLCKKRKWGGTLIAESLQNEKKEIPTRQAVAIPTNSAVTVSSYAYSKVTGPYSRWI